MPALLTRVAHPQGRGAASQEEAKGQTARDQGTSKAAMEGPTERGDEPEDQDEEEDKDKESQSGNKSSSSSEDEQPTKPPARSKGAMKRKPNEDPDEGKEGMADDIPIPHKMELRRKECEPRGRPTLRARAESRTNHSASKLASSITKTKGLLLLSWRVLHLNRCQSIQIPMSISILLTIIPSSISSL